jgi:hypothetical protein
MNNPEPIQEYEWTAYPINTYRRFLMQILFRDVTESLAFSLFCSKNTYEQEDAQQ